MFLESFIAGFEVFIVFLCVFLSFSKSKNAGFPLAGAGAAFLFSILLSFYAARALGNFNKAYELLSSGVLFSLYFLFCISITYKRMAPVYSRNSVCFSLLFFMPFFLCVFELSAHFLNLLKTTQLKENVTAPLLSVFSGFALSVFLSWVSFRAIKKKDWDVAQNAPLALMALFLFKMVAGGVPHAIDPPFVIFLRKVMETVSHDLLHIFFVTFQLPDHPYLNVRVYRWILLAVDKKVSVIFTFAAFFLFLLSFFYRQERGYAAPDTAGGESNAEKRRIKKQHLRAKKIRGFAYALSSFFLFFSVEQAYFYKENVYKPDPIPVIAVKGEIIAPLSDPFSSIENGRLRKFVYHAKNKRIVFFAVKKENGNIVAALDLCKICEPEGYSQISRNYLVCNYCATPIPVSTVGMEGGCNPVPVPSRIVESQLRINESDILKALKAH